LLTNGSGAHNSAGALQIGDLGHRYPAAVAAAWPLRVTTIAPSVTRNTRLVLVGHADGAAEVSVEGGHRSNLGLVDEVVRVGQPRALVPRRLV